MPFKKFKAFLGFVIVLFLLVPVVTFAGQTEFFYDQLNRLIRVQYGDGSVIEYEYDKLGNRTKKKTTLPQYTLSVNKDGTGVGTATSSPSGINCGADCSEIYDKLTSVTLSASPDSDSSFAGWSGGGCSGTGNCVVPIGDNDITVTATFDILPPVAAFAAVPTTGTAPLINVAFTDSSTRPATWLWDFGDGETSTAQNPTHTFRIANTYTVSLTVTNPSGSDIDTKTSYITVSACSNLPVKVEGTNPGNYSSLQTAYDAAGDGDTIKSQAIDFAGDLNLNRNITITLDGGYDCGFTGNPGFTVLHGDINDNDGTATVGNFILDTSTMPSVPDISPSPTSYDFGSVDVGSQSTAQIFTITNIGTGDLTIGTLSLTGTDLSEFVIQNDTCTSQVLTPSSSCTVDGIFSPTSTGAKSANLSIPSDDPDTPALNVPLSGTGFIPTPDITVTPTLNNFGSIAVGSQSTLQTFAVTNIGTANLTIGVLSLIGTDPSEFSKQNDTCTSQVLTPASNCTVQGLFSPQSTGAKSASLSIPSDDPDTPTLNVPLSGTGTQQTIILDVNFDNSEDGFNYIDDTFRNTNQPSYADGVWTASEGFGGGGALKVNIGGINNVNIFGMSGGWQKSFSLSASTNVVISFYYNLTQTPDYESDERSQVLVSVDGTLFGTLPQ